MPTTRPGDRLGLLDGLSLLTEVAEELGVRTARDTHLAWLDRVDAVLGRTAGPAGTTPGVLHRAIAQGVYGGLGAGLRATGRRLEAAAGLDLGERWDPPLDRGGRGRFVHSAVNGLIGDRLARERPRVAIPMGVRADGTDVPLDRAGLGAAFPSATGQLVVFLHGLCENESHWNLRREERGSSYPETVAALGWTPVMLRANTGLSIRENGAALASLLQVVTEAWPVPVERVALVGHSMGGLIFRAAVDVVTACDDPWVSRVSDVVTLGTPHLGAPLAKHVGDGARLLALLPELAAFGRILDMRSVGVHDLVDGLAEDVAPLPHARYHLVAGTLTRSPRHPVGAVLGDMLVRMPSACGRRGRTVELFPGADVLHVPGAGHFDLLNHPRVHRALADWLTRSSAPYAVGEQDPGSRGTVRPGG